MKSTYIILLIVFFTAGCTSFKTTILQRSTDDRFYGNVPKLKTKGVPVKLKVPTHVEVVVNETFFLKKGAGLGGTFEEISLTRGQLPVRAMTVATNVIYTDKVFTVDFRRPAGGTLTLSSMTMDDEQYFRNIEAKYIEQTLSDINTAINTIKPALSSSATIPSSVNLQSDEREVARARFDISDLGWEEQLQCFAERHVTGCYADCHYQN